MSFSAFTSAKQIESSAKIIVFSEIMKLFFDNSFRTLLEIELKSLEVEAFNRRRRVSAKHVMLDSFPACGEHIG